MADSCDDSPIELKRLPALDGLRGVAVVMVVVYHATDFSPTGPLSEAYAVARSLLWCGVDLFFVLSGFLISRILLATRDRPCYFRSFYARRTLRVFPLYYGILLGLFVVLPLAAWLVGGRLGSVTAGENYSALWHGQAWLWTYTHNFLQARGPSQLPGMGHFWSLAIEEQFYLVWPAVVWLARGWRLALVCGAIVVAAPAVRVALLQSGAEPWAVFHYTFTRCDALAWGALAAVAAGDQTLRRQAKRLLPFGLALAIVGLLVCGLAAGGWDKLAPPMQMAGYSLIAILFAAWVFGLAIDDNGRFGATWLSMGWLRAVGKYSYAIYLFHWPLCRAFDSQSPALRLALTLASSFALAWLSWHLWEKHWLRLKRYAPY